MNKEQLYKLCKESLVEKCFNLQQENQQLKEENQDLIEQLLKVGIDIQELIEKDLFCPTSCEKLEQLEQENKHLLDLQKSMDKQYSDLEHNWNELKKYVEDRIDTWDTAEIMLSKMQELEDGGNND